MKSFSSLLIVGNWKMNGTSGFLDRLDKMGEFFRKNLDPLKIRSVICVPATLIDRARTTLSGTGLNLGGQDCAIEQNGPYTGDISAEMLHDAGASHVLVGHSERRAGHGETDEIVSLKMQAAWRAGLVAILCIGETLAEHKEGQTDDVLRHQIRHCLPTGACADNTIIAYEPVWAIGSGLAPEENAIAPILQHIRTAMTECIGETALRMSILYGGSVDAANMEHFLQPGGANGVLAGRASLETEDFLALLARAKKMSQTK